MGWLGGRMRIGDTAVSRVRWFECACPEPPGDQRARPAGHGPGWLVDRLARHPWITAAGLTATVAAVAGGGLALAFSGGSGSPGRDCGLVPCAAALPASVRASAACPARGPGSGSTPAAPGPTAARRASAPPLSPSPSPPPSPPSAARQDASAGTGSAASAARRHDLVARRMAGRFLAPAGRFLAPAGQPWPRLAGRWLAGRGLAGRGLAGRGVVRRRPAGPAPTAGDLARPACDAR